MYEARAIDRVWERHRTLARVRGNSQKSKSGTGFSRLSFRVDSRNANIAPVMRTGRGLALRAFGGAIAVSRRTRARRLSHAPVRPTTASILALVHTSSFSVSSSFHRLKIGRDRYWRTPRHQSGSADERSRPSEDVRDLSRNPSVSNFDANSPSRDVYRAPVPRSFPARFGLWTVPTIRTVLGFPAHARSSSPDTVSTNLKINGIQNRFRHRLSSRRATASEPAAF